MAAPTSIPKDLFKVGESRFRVVWDDGHQSTFTARGLRLECPCAGCQQEWTGERLVDPASVPQDLKLANARLVGNYAVQFVYSDGHSTGLFSFETLRALCPCPSCKP